MAELEWAHAIAAMIGAVSGVAASVFGFGWRMGRVEGRLEQAFQTKLSEAEQRIEAKVEEARHAFDETLKGLRQKINDVELEAERRFLPKQSFDDFLKEYRNDQRRTDDKLDRILDQKTGRAQ